jgi:hypothetical protein
MLLEATEKPIRCRWPGGEILLHPGAPVYLPDSRGEELLMKAGRKVRRVPDHPVGAVVSWNSPVLPSPLSGLVLDVRPGEVCIAHPRWDGAPIWIPTTWLCGRT